jgi:hypothetical protein
MEFRLLLLRGGIFDYRISLNLWFKNAFPLWLLPWYCYLQFGVGSEVNPHRWIKLVVLPCSRQRLPRL